MDLPVLHPRQRDCENRQHHNGAGNCISHCCCSLPGTEIGDCPSILNGTVPFFRAPTRGHGIPMGLRILGAALSGFQCIMEGLGPWSGVGSRVAKFVQKAPGSRFEEFHILRRHLRTPIP